MLMLIPNYVPYLLDCKPRLIKFFFHHVCGLNSKAAYIQGRLTFFFFCFVLYLSYSHGKATVEMCFGCIRNLNHNKNVFVAKIGRSD